MTQTEWEGFYLDGVRAGSRPVRVRVAHGGLHLQGEGLLTFWPYESLEQTQGRVQGEHVRLERSGSDEALVVKAPGFVEAVRAIAPHAPVRGPLRLSASMGLIAGVAAGTAAVLGAGYFFALPALVAFATAVVPPAWEAQLGQRVASELVPVEERCEHPQSQAALEAIVARLAAAHPSPYQFKVVLHRDEEVNAFAAPGGVLILNTGLVAKTRRPEELAGVLAHEMQHVYHRHSTEGLLRGLSLHALLTAMTGDAGSMGELVGVASSLGNLAYQREDETEADREGMALVRAAGLSSEGMIEAFEMLSHEGAELPEPLAFLSTHPATGDRLAELKRLAAAAGPRAASARPLLPGVDWAAVRAACE